MRIPALGVTDAETTARLLGLDLSDAARLQAFLAGGHIDVQAVPGSGKTTVLAAKLVALALRWEGRHCGVCVLSHTNVAREEICRRVAAVPGAEVLLRAPHFIGTFQQFAHTFLALPALREEGLPQVLVDDDRFEVAAGRACAHEAYKYAYDLFEQIRKYKGGGQSAFRLLEYLDADLSLGVDGEPLGVGKETVTYRTMATFKRRLHEKGLFRFRDMFAIAARRLRRHPELGGALCRRFPLVIIDEVQDTEGHQAELISSAFTSSVIQRFGDIHQKIYSGAGVTDGHFAFPQQAHVVLSDSRRFGQRIADVGSRLCHPALPITGAGSGAACAPYLFTFTPERIARVLPAFSSIVLRHLPDTGGAPVVKALGLRVRRLDAQQHEIPDTVADYWDGYEEVVPTPPERELTLCDYLGYASLLWREGRNSALPVRLAKSGVERAIQRAQLSLQVERTSSAPERDLRINDNQGWMRFRRALRHWLHRGFTEQTWPMALSDLLVPFGGQVGSPVVTHVIQRAAWCGSPLPPPDLSVRERYRAVYSYSDPDTGRRLAVEVASIHAAKGETHDATLVLDTFSRVHVVADLLPRLASGLGGAVGVQRHDRMRSVFVASTRPRHLLAYAVRADHVKAPVRAALLAGGWEIVDLG